MFCFGMMTSLFLGYFYRKKINGWMIILFLFSGWMYWNIKYYVAVILVISMLSILIADTIESKTKAHPDRLAFLGIFILLIIAGSFLHPNFSLSRIIGVLHENHVDIIRLSDSRNIIPFIPFNNPFYGFLVNIPISLFGGLFMPLPFQGKALITLAPGFLNLAVLLLTMLVLYRKIIFPMDRSRWLVYGIILYIITLSVMMAYSTPNFGTLERYKVSYLPLFLFLVLAGRPFWFIRRGKQDISTKQ